jgi:AcrR family transcriptional regulator
VPKLSDRRSIILEHLASHVLAQGVSASSLRPLAKAAKVSDRMLLYYFKDKADIMTATLDVVAARLVTLLDAGAVGVRLPVDKLQPQLFALLTQDTLWPYMRLWLEIASLAAKGDPLYRIVGEAIARQFLLWGESQLESVSDEARAVDAARLLIGLEGMILLKGVGLCDICRLPYQS